MQKLCKTISVNGECLITHLLDKFPAHATAIRCAISDMPNAPKPVRMYGRRRVYRQVDLDNWLASFKNETAFVLACSTAYSQQQLGNYYKRKAAKLGEKAA